MTTSMSAAGRRALANEEGTQHYAYPDPASELYHACLAAGVSPYNNGYKSLSGWQSLDPKPWTIGIGQTGPGIGPGTYWTDEEIDRNFAAALKQREDVVSGAVRVALNHGQYDALISLDYSIGSGAFLRSTLLRKLNEGDYQGAADQFLVWNIPSILVPRRYRERAMFLGDASTPSLDDGGSTAPKASTADVQRALGVVSDGVWGPKTKAAVILFQSRHGLVADGIVGPITLEALGLS